jgi:hypothetical protein
MRPLARLGFAVGLAGAAALMSGCDKMSLDPDKLDFSLFDTKTKLSGDRKEVFPGGVPGVTPGVPPELVKGYHEQPDTPAPPEQKAVEAKPKAAPKSASTADGSPPAEQKTAEAKPKPAPKPHVVQQPKPQPAQTASVQGTAASTAPAAPAAQAPGSQPLPWPGQQQQQAQPQAGWPAPSPGR